MTTKKSLSKGAAKPARGQRGVISAAVFGDMQKNLFSDLLTIEYRYEITMYPFLGHGLHCLAALYNFFDELQSPEEFLDGASSCGIGASGISHWCLQNDNGDRRGQAVGLYTFIRFSLPNVFGRLLGFLTTPPSHNATFNRVRSTSTLRTS